MILPILTYSSTIKTTFTATQSNKFATLERQAAKIIGKPVINSVELINTQIQSLVIKCINKETGHEVFDNYFEVKRHCKSTRNNELLLNLPTIKLEILRPSF